MEDIIQHQICHDTIQAISDSTLLPLYKQYPYIQKCVLEYKTFMTDEQIDRLLSISNTIPPGIKGYARNYVFTNIIKSKLYEWFNDSEYELVFDTMCPWQVTQDCPSWYIMNWDNGKYIIGFNRIDLWNGGHQRHRFQTYLKIPNILCVVCNDIKITTNSRLFKYVYKAVSQTKICWLNGLEDIILEKLQIK